MTTVIQFPSRAKPDEFYNSAEYKKASEFRKKVATSIIALVEQFSWPAVGDYFRGGWQNSMCRLRTVNYI
jgi:hypothetical protein